MPRVLIALVALLLLLAGRWWLMREPPPAPGDAPTPATKPATEAATKPAAAEHTTRAQRLRDGAAARATKHRQITEALAARAAAGPPSPAQPAKTAPATPSPPRPPTRPDADTAGPPPALLDRTGNHAYLARVLSEDLLPLVHECEALAREQHPELAGMLVLNVDILGDEQIGGVIDTLEPAPTNTIDDPGLLECVRESLLATTLPAPDQGGRDAVALSLRIGPDTDAAAKPGG